ncbi:hypothetical protein Tco_0891304 [Tanacetum coccineum]|uniref:Uncharacterized protein n=1 Tax=Tanacetum coccineum TaxID=301880 RepID=A0ABQ5C4L8_9ASTR
MIKSALDYRRGGNFREKMLEKFSHIRNKSQSALFRKLRLNSRASTNAPSSTSSPSNNSFEIQQMAALLEEKMNIWIDPDPDDDTSSGDDDFEDIKYVSFEEVNNVEQEEKEFDLEDILQIQDVILREKLLNVHRLISNIESLKVNSTPDRVLESPFPFPIPVADSDSFLEESDTSLSHLDNSLPEFKTSSDHTEETRSGSTTTHANYSLPEYDSFLFEIEPDQEGLISIDNSNNTLLELPEFESFHFDPSFPRPPPEPPDVEICLHFEPDAPVIDNFNELNDDQRGSEIDFSQNVEDDDSFTFVIRTFLPFLTYPEGSLLSCSTGSEDTIFDPGIST